MSARADLLSRRRFLSAAVTTIPGLELTMNSSIGSLLRGLAGGADTPLTALRGATAWVNSPALTETDLRGKVVLVNFCTYTCINWLRQLPYVRAWAGDYRDRLVVIGVHTPEFGFEHDLENVRRALQAMRIDYPIAVDNQYAIWNGFSNQYWPALYLVDSKGAIRYRHFGEGAYNQTERMLQQQLAEAGAAGIDRELVTVNPNGIEAAADWPNLASPENYLGSGRTEHFVATLTGTSYVLPSRLRLNDWGVTGGWTVGKNLVSLDQPNGKIVCRFHARDLHLVMGPPGGRASVRCRVRLDGQPPGAAHGGDVDGQGEGIVREQRLYQLIRQPDPIGDRTFEIEFLDAGVDAFAFTFG